METTDKQYVYTPGGPPDPGTTMTELDQLTLENFKLQAQVVTQAAEIASLRARLSVQQLQAQHDAYLQKMNQPTAEEKEKAEWEAFHKQCDQKMDAEKLSNGNTNH